MTRLGLLLVVFLSFLSNLCFAQSSTHFIPTAKSHHITSPKSSNILDLTALLSNKRVSLVVKDPSSGTVSYTQDGIFLKKGHYFYQNNSRLQGFPLPSELTSDDCKLTDVEVPADTLMPHATTTVTMTHINLNAMDSIPKNPNFSPSDNTSYNYQTTATIYDSLGIQHSLTLYYIKMTTVNQWTVQVYVDGIKIGDGRLYFTPSGQLLTATGLINLSFNPGTGAMSPQVFSIIAAGTTQFGSLYSSEVMMNDGFPSGDAIEEVVDENGYITETYTNGESIIFSKIAVVSAK